MKQRILLIILSGSLFCLNLAQAMPEATLSTHTKDKILPLLQQSSELSEEQIQSKLMGTLSQTGIPALDALWENREDIRTGECSATKNDCRVLSVFRGSVTDRPLVIFVGLTGYRHMYLEQVYDELQAGYGPIYVGDFTGGGENFKPEKKPGEATLTVEEFLKTSDPKVKIGFKKAVVDAAGENAPKVESILNKLPIGIGHLNSIGDYVGDVNFILQTAANQNPEHKLTLISLSASGLGFLFALAQNQAEHTWIAHLDRVILESPMIQLKIQNTMVFPTVLAWIGKTFFGSTKVVSPEGSLPEFVHKSLGIFDPANIISHSPNRMSLTDSLRVWNGFETAGASFGWANEIVNVDYSPGSVAPGFTRINELLPNIRNNINNNNISMITVASEADGLVNTPATKDFLHDLADLGTKQLSLCLFHTAQHVIDQESDKYRDPYMALIRDQLAQKVSASYGQAPQEEPLLCSAILK